MMMMTKNGLNTLYRFFLKCNQSFLPFSSILTPSIKVRSLKSIKLIRENQTFPGKIYDIPMLRTYHSLYLVKYYTK